MGGKASKVVQTMHGSNALAFIKLTHLEQTSSNQILFTILTHANPRESFLKMDPATLAPPSKRPPPRIQRILKFLKLRKAGVPIAEPPWQLYQLQNSEFDELQRWLKQDEDLWGYVEDKVRYDYDSEKGTLVSRRPTMLHSCFMSFVAQEITMKLDEIATSGDPAASTFAQKICSMGSARIDLLGTEEQEGKPKMRRDPDFSFRHRDAQWAGVVLELSYPSKRRALPHLADDYLLETDGNIRMLVGLDLDTDTKRGTISTWQPNFKRNEQGVIVELEAALVRDAEVFRDKLGNVNQDPESGLHLDLEDFGPPDLTVDLTDEVPIFIDSATLCLLLAQAEARQFNMDVGHGGVTYKPKGLKIRKRRREEMDSSNEVTEKGLIKDNNIAIMEEEHAISKDEGLDNANVSSRETSTEEKVVSAADVSVKTSAPQEKDSQDIA